MPKDCKPSRNALRRPAIGGRHRNSSTLRAALDNGQAPCGSRCGLPACPRRTILCWVPWEDCERHVGPRGRPPQPRRGMSASKRCALCRRKSWLKGVEMARYPRNGSWTGWSARLWGCGARRDDAEWSFHSKEEQRRPAPPEPCNLPRSGLTKRVKRCMVKSAFAIIKLGHVGSGQLPFLGLLIR
jgi:hypothetical protein